MDIKDYADITDQELLKRAYYIDMKNRQLQGRIAQLEPYKQREIKNPPKQKHDQLFEKFGTSKYALKIMYVGSNYNGMEFQETSENTIESFLYKCLFGLSLIKQKSPGKDYSRAARTDKGVSAYGNVVALNLRTIIQKESLEKLQTKDLPNNPNEYKTQLNYVKMLNSILPEDIRVIACTKVDSSFNARYSCYQRSYKYFFQRGYYNMAAMQTAIKKFEGKHNFINFCKMDITSTIDFQKTMLHASIEKCENSVFRLEKDIRNQIYYFHFTANSFLWHQIRYMVTILFLIGMQKQTPEVIDEMLDLSRTPNKPNYPPASEFPLILSQCKFKDVDFKVSKENSVDINNTLNNLIMSKIMQMTLYVNCVQVMKGWALKSIGFDEDSIIKEAVQANIKNEYSKNKRMQLNKATGINYVQKQQILQGRDKELHQKRMEKKRKYEDKQDP